MIGFSASERGIRNITSTIRNIVDDYGATPGGSGTVNGDYTAFKNFHDFAIEQTGWVTLILPPSPPGKYYGVNGSYTYAGNQPFFGIKKLIVLGYGAAMNGLHGGSMVNSAMSTRADIYSVNAGATKVQLKNIEDASLFEPDKMVLLAGLDLQGFGYPPNPYYFEWHRIASVSGDEITFTKSIKHSYKDNWPRYFDGHEYELGGFGAATICRTMPGWDCEHRIYGLRSYKPGQQTYYFVRKSYLYDVKSSDDGWILGASEDMRIIGQEHTTSGHEVDKLTTNALIGEYGPSNRNINIQSSSIENLEIRGGSRTVNGTAKNTLIHGGSSPTIRLGPNFYGISEKVTIRDHVVTTEITGSSGLGVNLGDDLVYEGDGIFRYSGDGPPPWFVPGAVGILNAATVGSHHVFRIIGVSSDDDDILIETDIVGAELPALDGFDNVSIARHSAPNLTVENCSGCPTADELSLVPPNSPYGIFTRRTYAGSPHSTVGTSMGHVFGRLVHVKFNVTQAYTGVASNYRLQINQFHYRVVNSDRTVTNVQQEGFYINLKAAGERIITPGGVTGEQTGDVGLNMLTGGVWLPGPFSIFLGTGSGGPVDVSGEDASVRPIVTVEVLTDQEIPPMP